jgi:hypothetical protein
VKLAVFLRNLHAADAPFKGNYRQNQNLLELTLIEPAVVWKTSSGLRCPSVHNDSSDPSKRLSLPLFRIRFLSFLDLWAFCNQQLVASFEYRKTGPIHLSSGVVRSPQA